MSKSKIKKHKEAHWSEVMRNIDSSMVALWQKIPLIEAENKELREKIDELKKLCDKAYHQFALEKLEDGDEVVHGQMKPDTYKQLRNAAKECLICEGQCQGFGSCQDAEDFRKSH